MSEYIIIGIIVAIAAFLVMRNLARQYSSSSNGCSGCSCSGCDKSGPRASCHLDDSSSISNEH